MPWIWGDLGTSSCMPEPCAFQISETRGKIPHKESLLMFLALVTPWTVVHQACLSIGFSRQECWSRLPFPSPGRLPNPGIQPEFPALQKDSLLTELWGKPPKAWGKIPHKEPWLILPLYIQQNSFPFLLPSWKLAFLNLKDIYDSLISRFWWPSIVLSPNDLYISKFQINYFKYVNIYWT